MRYADSIGEGSLKIANQRAFDQLSAANTIRIRSPPARVGEPREQRPARKCRPQSRPALCRCGQRDGGGRGAASLRQTIRLVARGSAARPACSHGGAVSRSDTAMSPSTDGVGAGSEPRSRSSTSSNASLESGFLMCVCAAKHRCGASARHPSGAGAHEELWTL